MPNVKRPGARFAPTPAPVQATPARAPEPLTVVKARTGVNVASLDFETARGAYAAAGDRLNAAQIELARAMAAPK